MGSCRGDPEVDDGRLEETRVLKKKKRLCPGLETVSSLHFVKT